MDHQNETDSLGEIIRSVREGQETVFDLLGENAESVRRVEISRRQLQPELPQLLPPAPKQEAQARDHVFHDRQAFSQYVKRESDVDANGGLASLVLADVDARTMTAVFDEGDDEDRETVTLEAVEHPLFTPWAKLLDKPVPVIEFALFCMKHRRAVIDPDGRELAMTFSQVKMSRAITMHTGVGKKSLNGVVVDLEIAGEKKGVPVELPETIAIEVPLFVGAEAQRIEIDLLVTNSGEQVVVFATAADVDQQRIEAFEQMVEAVREETGLLVGLGRYRLRPWDLQQYHTPRI